MAEVMPPKVGVKQNERAATGVDGFDDVLGGGLPGGHMYLIEGDPGAGKTTLALQFLLEGVRRGERALYLTLSETRDELTMVAASHGLSLDGVDVFEVVPSADDLGDDYSTMYHPSEVELGETMRLLLAEADRVKPARLVLDSLTELRLLADGNIRYRHQVLALKQYFQQRGCTVLLLDDRTVGAGDGVLQSVVHGVVTLQRLSPEYGAERRRMRVQKLRGTPFHGGYHDFIIGHGGLQIFPRLVAANHRDPHDGGVVGSGIAELDRLLGGGFPRGTSTLIVGPAGAGKSVITSAYAAAAAQRGERAAIFAFDESVQSAVERAEGLGTPLTPYIESGLLTIQQVDPAELAPTQFTHAVRVAVERDGAKLVVIDSLNGYLNAMPEERFLLVQLHELLSYLGQKGVLTFLIVGQAGLIGPNLSTPVDASYVADTVVLLRFYENMGEIQRAISVVKKRRGPHDSTIHRFTIGMGGLRIYEPLKDLEGVLTGMPRMRRAVGEATP